MLFPLILADLRSSKVMKSSTLNQPRDEKDYFQVTDELAKENSHFAMSEALLAVVEQVRYNLAIIILDSFNKIYFRIFTV